MDDRNRDRDRADKALDRLGELLDSGDPELILAACKVMPALLERRSKLLGLDAVPGEQDKPATDRPLDRILKAVPKTGGA